jgi:16S rRNA (cytosine967-C5)-methyltransferase
MASDVLDLRPETTGTFDLVLLDAPCTGCGTLRRNPDIKWRRHPKDPYRFSQIQKRLLEHAARFVREGGALVYATCTVFREENEDVATDFTNLHPGWVLETAKDFLPPSCRHMTEGSFFKSWPHRHGVDGFFGARWGRPD